MIGLVQFPVPIRIIKLLENNLTPLCVTATVSQCAQVDALRQSMQGVSEDFRPDGGKFLHDFAGQPGRPHARLNNGGRRVALR